MASAQHSTSSSATVENLIINLLEWIGTEPRAYAEVLEAWQTSCPRFPVWEDETDMKDGSKCQSFSLNT